MLITRVGQNHIYTVYIRFIWQGNHQIYGGIRRIYIRFWPTLLITVGVHVTVTMYSTGVGLARTIYIRCTYGIFGLEITKYTVYIYTYIYGSGQLYTGDVYLVARIRGTMVCAGYA